MAARTKSFFDQDHQRKPRPGQWSRRPYDRSATEVSAHLPPPKLPIPATSQAKSKLQAFQFVAAESKEGQSDGVSAKRKDMGNGSDSGMLLAPSSNTSKAPPLPHANTFPCTPGARLPLEDLIGNCDETIQKEPVQESPEEHIGWIPHSSSDLLTPNQRKRKRAKSSSPSCPNTSSQQERVSGLFGENGAPSTAKRTPAADPATDLWQRYANGRSNGETLNVPEIGNLIFQGSPRPLETPVKGGPLRRWASTGNDWPSTKNKKRRTGTRQSINVWQDQTAVESGGKSKVATMVQKIQETLASQKLEQAQAKDAAKATDAPSSSSPLPEVGAEGFPTPAAVSPLQTRQPNLKSPLRAAQASTRIQEIKPPSQRQQFRPTQSGGVRSENLRPVGDPLNPGGAGSLHLYSKAPLPAYKRPSITRVPSQPKVQVIAPPAPPANKDIDDFGDDAFDLTADDLDELLTQAPVEQRALYDIPQLPNRPSQVHKQPIPRNEPIRPQPETITLDDDDEFGDDDIDEDSFVQAEFSATQAQRKSPDRRSPRKKQSPTKAQGPFQKRYTSPFQRYVVKQIIDGEYANDKGRRLSEKVVLAEAWRTSQVIAITLRDSWMSTSLSKGNVIHIARLRRYEDAHVMDASPPGQTIIDDKESSSFLIVHPDHMLSATTVADSFDCVRKAVLQDRIKATGETSKAMVYGKILHEIFQQALSANLWVDSFMSSLVDRTVQTHVEGLWEIGMADTNLAIEEIKAKMGELAAWANVFVRETPSDTSLVDDKQGEKVWMSISKLIAIEEHIWSPQFGLKGNVDATIQTTLVDDPNQPDKKLIVPFEVKTGRTTQSPAHRAQTALYTLLLSDRYDVAVEAGILYYLESSSMSRIAPPVIEVRQMVQQRNRLASYIFRARNPRKGATVEVGDIQMLDLPPPQSQEVEESGLPSLLKSPFKCGRCYAQQSCFTYHALVENGSAESAGMVDDHKKDHSLVWKEAVSHMLASKSGMDADMLKQWFTKWDKLLTFEESDQARSRKELWTLSSSEREAVGRCFGDLTLKQDLSNTATTLTQQVVDGIEGSGGKINRYAYVFTRAKSTSSNNFTDGSQLTIGEPIVISSEQGQWALANGYIVAITKYEVTVAVDRKLGDARQRMQDFDGKVNQTFRGTMVVGSDPSSAASSKLTRYRLDKDEFSNGLALVRNNLVTLMSSHPIHTKLRNQIVFGAKPVFEQTSTMPDHQPTQLGAMNEDQQAAVRTVLNAQDYALILGMPGTGKTTTIAHIIGALLSQGKSILLTSFTHTAVDNILLKIREIAPPDSILRLGVPAKINNQVQEFCRLAATPRQTIQEVEDAYMGTRIVATTCMGTNHALFHRRTFDVCIVDEASQITLPTILGPLLYARKYVLVGDHFQLPPLVQNKAALEGGMDVSLFRQLSEEHGDAVAALGRQYRMCAEIMMLSNELIYSGQLRCGNDEVASRTIRLPDPEALKRFHRGGADCQDCWIQRLTAVSAKVVFANTDLCGQQAKETLTAGGKNITNQLEALVSAEFVLSCLAMGVPARDIGVITLYRSQLSLIRQLFKKAGVSTDVEIDSADRYQGRDKECIILSMVRSNDAGIVGDLLKDWRRVNVALTRARSKLVVVGSRGTLVNNELLAKFLALVDREGWAMNLPNGCEEMHGFDFSTQITQSLVVEENEARSPVKNLKADQSPAKKIQLSQSPRGVLQPSSGNANQRSPAKKASPKRILGGKGSRMTEKLKLAREKIAMEMMFDEREFGDDLLDV